MPTPFEIAQAMALQQVQKRKTMADAELANTEARYKPANYAAENALKQAKTSLIPYEMANYQSLVGYRNMLNQYMPTDYAIKAGNLRARQEQLDFDKRNYGSTFGKALNDFERIKQAYGENSPQAKSFQDYIDKEAAGSQGVQVFGANGNPLVQIGGSSRGNKSGGTY